jgi:histidyl-tRNA synthetase
MSQKPSIPKGTRDFLPLDVAKRSYLFSVIRSVYEKHGFLPIETPSFELSSTLMGKYGEEGDRLIFRLLNSGDKMKKADLQALEAGNLPKFASSLSEKALRYDLTVPFARFVAQHQNDITFPFKRYQIQAVWRADRPQHGRYQEFYQCDGDSIGSDSLLNEVEFIQIIDSVLTQLAIPSFTIKINNRKILSGIAEVCGEAHHLIPITVALDKMDKIGSAGVIAELESKGLSQDAIDKISPLFSLKGSPEEQLHLMENYLSNSVVGLKGIEELRYVFQTIAAIGVQQAKIEFDVTLARGLNYYTGAIFEVKVDNINMGSICGGGRYDDLTATFGLSGVSGVGISFGADRIYDVLEELNLFPKNVSLSLSVLFVNLGHKESLVSMQLAKELRSKNIDCEVYPSAAKLQKQLKYANERGCAWVVIIGEEELKNQQLSLKNMESGEQFKIAITDFISEFSKL